MKILVTITITSTLLLLSLNIKFHLCLKANHKMVFKYLDLLDMLSNLRFIILSQFLRCTLKEICKLCDSLFTLLSLLFGLGTHASFSLEYRSHLLMIHSPFSHVPVSPVPFCFSTIMAFSFFISPKLSSISASSMFHLQDLHHGFGALDDLVYRLDSCLLQLFSRNCWHIISRWSIFNPCATAHIVDFFPRLFQALRL